MKVMGKGSVIQREPGKQRGKCRTWELSVLVDVAGQRKRRTRTFHGKWRDANIALISFREELADAAYPSDYTFKEYAYCWHECREHNGLYAPKTICTEKTKIQMLCSVFGKVKLEALTESVVSDGFNELNERYSFSTLKSLRSVLSNILASAVRKGILSNNPAKQVKLSNSKLICRHALSAEELDEVARTLDPSDGKQLAALLCLTCGLRRGEVIALRWEDWDGTCIHVERADDGNGFDKSPKTRAGVRTVPVPSQIAIALDSMKQGAKEPICADEHHRRLKTGTLGAWWARFRRQTGVECTLHELRHSYLTQLARAGVHPRVMMQLAGHSSMKVCLEIYTHVSDEMQRDAVRKAFG